jgi:Domain of unknown function (DUF4338)
VLRYVAVLDGEWVALVGFGSAALSCAARDRFLGWEQRRSTRAAPCREQPAVLRAARRGRPNLASAVLSRVLRRLAGDYLAVYGHRVLAVETFTDPPGTPVPATPPRTSRQLVRRHRWLSRTIDGSDPAAGSAPAAAEGDRSGFGSCR